MALIAALPMYRFPWTEAAEDRLWAALAERLRDDGVDAPERLTREGEVEAQWRNARLVFGQTCGYPLMRSLRDAVVVLAAPAYAFDGCEGPRHSSFLIARAEDSRCGLGDFKGARAAINGRDSNTGMNLFRAAVAPLANGRPFFSATLVTGAHLKSMEAVADDRADIAAIDCVTFAHAWRGRPELASRLKVLGRTASTLALPFIASARLPEMTLSAIREALRSALVDPALRPALATLGLVGAVELDAGAYEPVLALERQAAALGYPELA